MRQHAYAVAAILAVALLAGCSGVTGDAPAGTNDGVATANLLIEGMTCQGCALGVEYELKQVAGVIDADVDYRDGTGLVTYDPAQVDPETIAKASTVYPARIVR